MSNTETDNVRDGLVDHATDFVIDDLDGMMKSIAKSASQSDSACFRQVVEAIPDAVIIHRHGRIIYANPAAGKSMIGQDADALIGRDVLDFVAAEYRDELNLAIKDVMASGGSSNIVPYVRIDAEGRRRSIETVAVRITSEGGAATLNVCRDMTQREQVETALRESEARFREFAEHSPEATIAICNRRIVIANRAAASLMGFDESENLLDQDALEFCHQGIREKVHYYMTVLEQGMAIPKLSHGRLCKPDGDEIDVEWTSVPFSFGGQPAAYLIFRDVTERLQVEENHRYLASHDPLTGLINRLEFQKHLKSMMEEERTSGEAFAVHYLDLDYFKTINDTLGHQVGDKLLQTVASRLRLAVRSADIVARLGGDEFAIIQLDTNRSDASIKLARQLQEAIEQPYAIGEDLVHTSVTIGIAMFPEHGENPELLLRRADLALYRAKERGRNAVSFYSDDLDIRIRERDSLVAELIRAEARNEFDVFMQPIVSLCSGQIEAFEALLRWNHPARGLLPADAFIHAIESSREAQRIAVWVLRKACEHAKSWQAESDEGLRVSVNLSMPLLQRHDLVELVKSCLDEFQLRPERLELELTERMVITVGALGVEQKLTELHDMGVRIAIDDFGTGFSSLALLRDLPIDRIKIDRSFIAGFGTNADDTAIVRAVTNLGRSMNKRVTAEGVESSETLELLRTEGCHEIQGYHLARPMPADEVAAFLKIYQEEVPIESNRQRRGQKLNQR